MHKIVLIILVCEAPFSNIRARSILTHRFIIAYWKHVATLRHVFCFGCIIRSARLVIWQAWKLPFI